MSLRKTHQPLYLLAADRLREKITRLEPGQRLPAETRLATEYGVSVATIREAIRVLVAEGRVEPQQGRGTIVLSQMRKATGVLLNLDILDSRTSRFYPLAALEMRRLLEAAGRKVRHYYGRASAENPCGPIECDEFFADVAEGKLEAVLALGTQPEERLLSALAALPSVGMYEGFPRFIQSDVDDFLDKVIGHAVREGRSNIAMLAWNAAIDPNFCNFAQFRQAAARFGVTARQEWHRSDLHPYLAGAGWETFREVWTSRKEKPDALVITDDCLFADASKAILNLGIRVPEELLVITHSVKEAPVPSPFPVCRITSSAHEAAREMVRLLDQPASAHSRTVSTLSTPETSRRPQPL